MVTFSANLGFLWDGLPLPIGIQMASKNGFSAVECHWPYETPANETKRALDKADLTMLSLNTRRGDDGEMGLAAIPGRTVEARLAIDEAIRYGAQVGAQAVHVMAGNAPPVPASFLNYLANLRYACRQAATFDMSILIEPLNLIDNPGYYLRSFNDALGVIEAVDCENMKLLFDVYHVEMIGRDPLTVLDEVFPVLGHVQFASVPGRNEPHLGSVDYQPIFDRLDELGWTQPLGAEYRPAGDIIDGLVWMQQYR